MKEQTVFLDANQSRPIQPHMIIDRDWCKNAKADFAQDLVRSAMLQPKFGAERENYQALGLLSINEIVKRACDLSEETFSEFERRGWLMPIPLYHDLIKQLESESTTRTPGF